MSTPGFPITDRYTEEKFPGPFILAEDMEGDCECPTCGAEEGQQCSEPDPQNAGMGIELGRFIHANRCRTLV